MPDEHIRFLAPLAAAIDAGDDEARIRLPTFEPWLRRFLLSTGAPAHQIDPTFGADARRLALSVLTYGHA